MGSWGFIGLAYGVASAVLVGYLLLLRRRLWDAREELTALEKDGGRRAR